MVKTKHITAGCFFETILVVVLPIRPHDAQDSIHEGNKVDIPGPLVPGELLLDQDAGFLDEPGHGCHGKIPNH